MVRMAKQEHISAYLGAFMKPKEETMENYFVQLNNINVNEHTEKKNGLTYLSWAWAWAEVKKLHPDATYTIYEDMDGCFYYSDGKTCWVKTGVTVNGIEHIEYLPVMDHRNRSIPLENVTSFDVNKAVQRSLTKACARHGLGLYIYAGEDLPEGEAQQVERVACAKCGAPITDGKRTDGSRWPASEIVEYTKLKYGQPLCFDCGKQAAKEAK